MRSFKKVLSVTLMFLVISLACNAVSNFPTTLEPIDTPPPMEDDPTLELPTEELPTLETLPQGNYPSRIVYSRFVEGEGIFIHAVDANGQNDTRLTQNDCLGALPVWSNDGARIAYYCYSQQKEANLWVMNQDGSDAHFVAKLPGLLIFKWSPDNQHLVYHAPQADGSENDIYVLDLTSGNITDITEDSPVWDAFPDWSPDGSRIVFTSDRAPSGKALDDIWTVKPDGTDLTNLTNNGEAWEDYHPAWSPDGKSIAFFRTGGLFNEKAEGGPAGLWAMDADGQNQRLVAAVDMFRAVGAPVWSPDGQYLAYIDGMDQEENVWVVSSAGGEPVKVGSMAGEKSDIAWSPDSKALIFTNDNNSDNTLLIYLALPDGSDTHPLLSEGRYGYGDWAP